MPDQDQVLDNMEERKARREKRKGPGIVKIIVAVVLLGGLYAFTFTPFFLIDKVDVSGNSYYSDEEIANIAHADKGANLYHSVSRSDMKKYLEADPFIEKASVIKLPPGTVRIKVEERRQVGAIVYGEEYLIIDKDGMLLRRTRTRPRITIITGIRVREITEGERIGATDETMFRDALDIITAMEEGDLYFMELEMTEMYCTAHVYDALVVVGTSDQLVESMRLGRLQKILETLFSRGIKRGTINVSEDGFASFNPAV